MSKVIVDKLPGYAAECPFSKEVNGTSLCACDEEPATKCVLEVYRDARDCPWLTQLTPAK